MELLKSFLIFMSEDKFSLFRIIQDNRILADFDSPHCKCKDKFKNIAVCAVKIALELDPIFNSGLTLVV